MDRKPYEGGPKGRVNAYFVRGATGVRISAIACVLALTRDERRLPLIAVLNVADVRPERLSHDSPKRAFPSSSGENDAHRLRAPDVSVTFAQKIHALK